MEREYRVVDASGAFVRLVNATTAEKMANSGKAEIRGTGRRAYVLLKSQRVLADYRGGCRLARLETTYEEQCGDHKLVILKRLHRDGTFHEWDEGLSFEDLRQGKTVSEATKIRRREEAAIARLAAAKRPPASQMEESFLPEAA